MDARASVVFFGFILMLLLCRTGADKKEKDKKGWSACSTTCGDGTQRKCNKNKCQERRCNLKPCSTVFVKSTTGGNTAKLVTTQPTPQSVTNKKQRKLLKCSPEILHEVEWPETAVRNLATKPCPGLSIGSASRRCFMRKKSAAWGKVNLAHCVSQEFLSIKEKVESMERINNKTMVTTVRALLRDLSNMTSMKHKDKAMNGGNLKIAIESLAKVSELAKKGWKVHSRAEDKDNFLKTASNLLDRANTDTWLQLQQIGDVNITTDIVMLVEDFGFQIAAEINITANNRSSTKLQSDNIAIRVDRIDRTSQSWGDGISFQYNTTSIHLPASILQSSASSQSVTVIYPTLNDVLWLAPPHGPEKGRNLTRAATTLVSSTLLPLPLQLNSPIKLTFKNKKSISGMNITCVSWAPGSHHAWRAAGCHVVPGESTADYTTCACTHMTVFAALLDPFGVPVSGPNANALELITIIGCSVSLVGIVITMAITLWYWKRLKSPRSEVLLNICLAIAATCVLVLVEPQARSKRVVCICMAALLHYFLLAVFAWMLCEGVLLYIVFIGGIAESGGDKVKYFYVFGWGLPTIIVSMSIGISQLQGYGEVDAACWLSIDNGLLWAFVAPALIVIMINTVVLAAILRRMLRLKLMQAKPRLMRVRAGTRAAAVILPLLGVTWVFGLLTFSTDAIVFKYLFAICNSLQGFMIFLFHCVFNNKVHDALRGRNPRRQSTSRHQSMVALPSIKVNVFFRNGKRGNRTGTTSLTSLKRQDEIGQQPRPLARIEEIENEATC